MTQQFQTRYLFNGDNWTDEKRCQYQQSRFIVSLLEEGKIVISGLGHMLILGPISMARRIRLKFASVTHLSSITRK